MWWTFAITSLALFMVTLDNLVVTTALPVIRDDLHSGLCGLEWTVNAYTLTFAVLLLTGAALGDRFGRRRMFAIGLGIFTLASAAAALAPSIGALDAARAVQGLGGAIVMPLTLTILSAAVPPERRGLALGAWGGISGLAVAFGPLVGGAVVSGISWHWIFWLNVPIGLVLAPLALLRLRGDARPGVAARPAGPRARERRPVRDRLGARPRQLRRLGLAGDRRRARRRRGARRRVRLRGSCARRAPMLPMRFFRNRTFALANVSSLFMFFGMFGSIFLLAQFFQTVQGYSPLQSGLRILPWTAMPIIVAPIAGALSDRIGGHKLMGLGLALQAIGLAWIAARLDADDAVQRARDPVRALGCRAWRSSSRRSRTSSSRRSSRRRRARRRAPTTRSASSAASSASRCSRRSSPTTAATRAAQAFVDGMTPAVYVGAAVVALGSLAAFGIKRRPRAAALAPAPVD